MQEATQSLINTSGESLVKYPNPVLITPAPVTASQSVVYSAVISCLSEESFSQSALSDTRDVFKKITSHTSSR